MHALVIMLFLCASHAHAQMLPVNEAVWQRATEIWGPVENPSGAVGDEPSGNLGAADLAWIGTNDPSSPAPKMEWDKWQTFDVAVANVPADAKWVELHITWIISPGSVPGSTHMTVAFRRWGSPLNEGGWKYTTTVLSSNGARPPDHVVVPVSMGKFQMRVKPYMPTGSTYPVGAAFGAHLTVAKWAR